MPEYEVEALGGQFSETVEADSESHAEDVALDILEEDFRHSVSVQKPSIYQVYFKYGGVQCNVLAMSRHEAEQNARKYVENRRDAVLDELPHGPERTFIQDLSTSVDVKKEHSDGHYEIDREGRWNEGTLE